MSHEERLNTEEAARYIGVAAGTLENWRTLGGGPKFIKLTRGKSGPVRYRKAALDKWLAERECEHT